MCLLVAGPQDAIKQCLITSAEPTHLEQIHDKTRQGFWESKHCGSFLGEDGEPALWGKADAGKADVCEERPAVSPSPPEGTPGCTDPTPTQARLPLDFPCPPGHKEQMGLLSFSPHIHLFLQKERTEQEMPPPECSLGGREERARTSSALHPPQPSGFRAGPGAQGPGPAAAGLTLQRECVRWRGELMSLGVDDRSPSAADASEMTEGCREWQGLTLTAGKQGQLVSEGWREWPHLDCLAGDGTNTPVTPRRTLAVEKTPAQLSAPLFSAHTPSESSFQEEPPIIASGSN